MAVDEELIAAARAARARAYAPYSGFAVGAALRLRDGGIVTGANIENASYGLTLCAERAALSHALHAGHAPGAVVAVAVATDAPTPTAPCGACRQWLQELAPAATVYCAGGPAAGPPLVTSVAALLPHAFGSADLGR
jgi:pyrimidine-nucleoside phosphorylase